MEKIKNEKKGFTVKSKKGSSGITLVALVVTIVVLLILAGITINLLFSDNGIINKAQNAADKTNEAVQNDLEGLQNLADQMNNVLGENSNNNNNNKWSQAEDESISNGKIVVHIGDYINYDCKTGATTLNYTSTATKSGYTGDQTFTLSDYNYGWRVLGVDESGQLQIIAEDFVPLTGGNSVSGRTYYNLKGQAGYVNGVEELNKISAIYGQGKGATGGRSVTAEDVNKITGYNPNNTGVRDVAQSGSGTKCFTGQINEYKNEVTYARPSGTIVGYNGTNGLTGSGNYSQFTYYDGSSWKSLGQNDGTSVNLTSNYYYYDPTTLTDTNTITASVGIGRNTNEYKMLFTNSSTGANSESVGTTDGCKYWLGSPFVNASPGYAYFGMRYVYSGSVSGNSLYFSDGLSSNDNRGVRPVVSLKSDISLEKAAEQKDSCDLWNIK